MAQNRSSAVMQQRSEPHDSLDDFPTPPWATRALLEWLMNEHGYMLAVQTCREPAANRGHMMKPLSEEFAAVCASDVHDYGVGYPVRDYLFGPACHFDPTHWTITNPPFKLAEQFLDRALQISTTGVCMFVRSAFLESVGRFERIYAVKPPTDVLQFSERVVLHKGKLAPDGSTATAYCWLVWRLQPEPQLGTRFHWIPPCRRQLERADDYAEPMSEAA